jgi:predicted enzyme related to lactoylglutathione lyase
MIRTFLVLCVLLLASQVSASKNQSDPIDYVGSVSINPSQDAKVLAHWYERFGIQTQEMNTCPKNSRPCIGYYKVTGSWFFAIHPKRKHAPKKSSDSVEIVFHVSDYDSYLANASQNHIIPKRTESDSTGRFAHFMDPDGNKVTIWGQAR